MNRHYTIYRTVSRREGVLCAERITDVSIGDEEDDPDTLASLYGGDFTIDDTTEEGF